MGRAAVLHEGISAGFQAVAQMASQQQCSDRRFRCEQKKPKNIVCFHCSICVLDFPHCVVHEMPELTAESLVSPCQRDF